MRASVVSRAPEELVRQYAELLRAGIEPDPLFRRRLRGIITNRFVAAREGSVEPRVRPSKMGRLGRACLSASFALAITVGGTLAVSRGAVPGDLLYPVKLQLEAIRLETFPERFRDDLLVYALGERTAELGRLLEDGNVERAAALAETIGAGYQAVAERGIEVETEESWPSLVVLDALSDRLPSPAQAVIEQAINEVPGLSGSRNPNRGMAAPHAGGPPNEHSRGVPAGGPAAAESRSRGASHAARSRAEAQRPSRDEGDDTAAKESGADLMLPTD